MDYDWLWVMLAVGVLAPVGAVPFALARDACCWWREQRRERRDREMAGCQLCTTDSAAERVSVTRN